MGKCDRPAVSSPYLIQIPPSHSFKLYELSDDTGHEVQLLQYLQRHRPSCDVWALSKLAHKRVLVPPTLQKSVEKFFADYHVNYTLQVEDFGRCVGAHLVVWGSEAVRLIFVCFVFGG